VADLLVDTDVFIDHLRGARAFDPAGHRVHYSVITRAELFAGTTATGAADTLLRPFQEIEVDRTSPNAPEASDGRRASGCLMP